MMSSLRAASNPLLASAIPQFSQDSLPAQLESALLLSLVLLSFLVVVLVFPLLACILNEFAIPLGKRETHLSLFPAAQPNEH
jgi:Mn2+/Fe2+ NRAMP family transporter